MDILKWQNKFSTDLKLKYSNSADTPEELSAPLPGGKGAESHSNRWYKAIPTYPVHHGQHPTRQPLCRLLTGKPILTYIGTGVGGLGIVFSIPTFIKIHKAGVIQSDF